MRARVEPLVDDNLMSAYAESVQALGTPDLVLYLSVADNDLQAFVRTTFERDFRNFLGEHALGNAVLEKVSRSAHSTLASLNGPLAFWLVVLFPTDEMACVAVRAQRIGAGSSILS